MSVELESKCPNDSEGVHRLGSGLVCSCGYKLHIGRLSVSIEVYDKQTALVSDCFNCDDIGPAISGLRRAIEKLERS